MLPPGLYYKPSGAVAAYPTILTKADPSLVDGDVRYEENCKYVSQVEYDRLLARADPMEDPAQDLDPEVGSLVAALNEIPTVRTTSSCCGHGRDPVMVFFDVGDMRWLYVIGRALDRNYGGYGFRCELSTCDLPERPVGFLLLSETGEQDLRGPSLQGEEAYRAADALAKRIREILASPHILSHFGLHQPG